MCGAMVIGIIPIDLELKVEDASQCRQLTFGPVGSQFGATSGPISLPTDGWNNKTSKFYTFEIGSSSEHCAHTFYFA